MPDETFRGVVGRTTSEATIDVQRRRLQVAVEIVERQEVHNIGALLLLGAPLHLYLVRE